MKQDYSPFMFDVLTSEFASFTYMRTTISKRSSAATFTVSLSCLRRSTYGQTHLRSHLFMSHSALCHGILYPWPAPIEYNQATLRLISLRTMSQIG